MGVICLSSFVDDNQLIGLVASIGIILMGLLCLAFAYLRLQPPVPLVAVCYGEDFRIRFEAGYPEEFEAVEVPPEAAPEAAEEEAAGVGQPLSRDGAIPMRNARIPEVQRRPSR